MRDPGQLSARGAEDLDVDAAEADGGADGMHGVGPGVHSGLLGALRAARRARGGGDHRANPGPSEPQQHGGGAERDQSDHGVHGAHHETGQHPIAGPQDGPATGDSAVQRAPRDPVRVAAQHQPGGAEASGRAADGDPRVLLQVQRPDLREEGEDGHHGEAGHRAEHRAGAHRVQGLRPGSRCGGDPQGGALDRPSGHPLGEGVGALRKGAAEPHPGEDELRGAGGDHRDPRYLPSLSEQVRVDHRHALPESGHARRARGQVRDDLDHRRVRGPHRQLRRAAGDLPGRLRRRADQRAALAAHRHGEAVPAEAQRVQGPRQGHPQHRHAELR